MHADISYLSILKNLLNIVGFWLMKFQLANKKYIRLSVILAVVLSAIALAVALTPPSGVNSIVNSNPHKYTKIGRGKVYTSHSENPTGVKESEKFDFLLPMPRTYQFPIRQSKWIWYDFIVNFQFNSEDERRAVLLPRVWGNVRVFVNGRLHSTGRNFDSLIIIEAEKTLIQVGADISDSATTQPITANYPLVIGKISDLNLLRNQIEKQVGVATTANVLFSFAIIIFGIFFLAYPQKTELLVFLIFLVSTFVRNSLSQVKERNILLTDELSHSVALTAIADFAVAFSLFAFSLYYLRPEPRKALKIISVSFFSALAFGFVFSYFAYDFMGAVSIRQPLMLSTTVLFMVLQVLLLSPSLLGLLRANAVPSLRKASATLIFTFVLVVYALNLWDSIFLTQGVTTEYRNGLILGLVLSMTLAYEVAKEISTAKVGEIALRVAHDIRSPLAALEMSLEHIENSDEFHPVLVQSAVSRIKSIAEDLIDIQLKSTQSLQEVSDTVIVMILPILDSIVSEKRMQYRGYKDVQIEFISKRDFNLFLRINVPSFKRTLSNLIDNAVQALNQCGHVSIALSRERSSVILSVVDSGMGIPSSIVTKVGTKGYSFGKRGLGIGVFEARSKIESWGGSLVLDSIEGKGTEVRVSLPQMPFPIWHTPELIIRRDHVVVVVDEEESIHHLWSRKFSSVGISELLHFYSANSFFAWVKNECKNVRFTALIDHNFSQEVGSSFGFLRENGIADSSYIITSVTDSVQISKLVGSHKFNVISKSVVPLVPIRLVDSDVSSKCDAVLIDNDFNLVSAWKKASELKGIKLFVFSSSEEFIEKMSLIDRSVPLFIDSSLDDGVRGEDFAKNLHEVGFSSIYITSGYHRKKFEHLTFLKSILGKEFPEFLKKRI